MSMSKDQTEKIIEAVLERIAQTQMADGNNVEVQKPKDHILVLYGESRHDIRESMRQMRILMEHDYQVSHVYTPKMLEYLKHWKDAGTLEWYPQESYHEEDAFQCMEILDQTDLVILPTWSWGFLTRLQEGHEDNLVQMLLQEVLCREMPLLMAEGDSAKFKNSEYYLTHLAGKVENMKQYGASVLPTKSLSGYVVTGKYQTGLNQEEDRSGIFTDTVFCSEDLKNVQDNRIIVGERTIVSQEARDRAKEKGIQIIKERKNNV